MHSCVDNINWITLEQIKDESGTSLQQISMVFALYHSSQITYQSISRACWETCMPYFCCINRYWGNKKLKGIVSQKGH